MNNGRIQFQSGRYERMFSYKDSNHQVVGPVSVDEIRQLIVEGSLNRNSLLSAEKSDFWQPAYRFDEFAKVFEERTVADVEPEVQPAEPTKPDEKSVSPEGPIDVESTVEPEPVGSQKTETAEESTRGPELGDGGQRGKPVRYSFVGGDGREYGPISAEQLEHWIKQRRADQNSRVRRDGSGEWTTLGELPEFQSTFAEQTKRQQASPPPLDSVRADQIADEIIGNGYNLNITDCFRRSWRLYLDNFGILTGTTALVIVILSFLNSLAPAGNVAGFALLGVLFAGLSLIYLKRIRGQTATIQDTFEGFNRCFVPLLVSSVLTSIFTIIGFTLCILPGIYLFVAWLFVFPLIFELRVDFWPAMELSRKVVHERWWEIFGLALAAGIVVFVGLLLFGLGVFFTAPIAIGAVMYAYEDIFKNCAPRESKPETCRPEEPSSTSVE